MLTSDDFHANYTEAPGCWVWEGNVMGAGMGYGRATVDGVRDYAHRHAWRIAFGDVPAEAPIVRHDCDNPLCVRPSHLRVGTHADNVRDAVDRARSQRGEMRHNAVLVASDVLEIRGDHRLLADIAADYGVSRSQVCRVRSGLQWAHIISTDNEGA